MKAFLKYKDLVFIVSDAPSADIAEYYYEEKLCPSDVLRNLEAVIDCSNVFELDNDPHGVFEYLGQSDKDDLAMVREFLDKIKELDG